MSATKRGVLNGVQMYIYNIAVHLKGSFSLANSGLARYGRSGRAAQPRDGHVGGAFGASGIGSLESVKLGV